VLVVASKLSVIIVASAIITKFPKLASAALRVTDILLLPIVVGVPIALVAAWPAKVTLASPSISIDKAPTLPTRPGTEAIA
jgi:hypothetical protein